MLSDMDWRLLAEWILSKQKPPPGHPLGPLLGKTREAERWMARQVVRAKKRWLNQHPGRERVPGSEASRMIDEATRAAAKRFGKTFIIDSKTPDNIRNELKSGRLKRHY
jgi:hypothetical protein